MSYDAEAHSNLGIALHDRGLWAEALPSLQRALAIKPHEVEALLAAANAMKALGRAREAVLLYQAALERSPQLVEATIISATRSSSSGNPTTPLAVTGARLRSSRKVRRFIAI